MPSRNAILYLPGEGGVEATLIRDLVAAAHDAHSGIIAFDRIVTTGRYWDFPGEPPYLRRWHYSEDWRTLTNSIVLEDERLIVASVELSSPGAWAFLGALNPLETIRKYLNDRHTRRQDREYREGEEQRQLRLENEAREIEVLRQRLQLAREHGVPDEVAAALLQRLVGHPLEALGSLQDRQVIDGSEARVQELPAGGDKA